MFAISVVISAICVIFRAPLLSLIFGKVDADVMENALTYMLITGLSFPFIGLYNASAALFRSSGNSKLPMTVSMISNCINIVGNAVFIFGMKMGVAGAALSTLISRVFCAIVIMYIQTKPKQTIYISNYLTIRPDFSMVKMILGFGIPTGIENGMFQFGKLAIQSTVSTLGTTAIAAQAMTAVLEAFSSMAGIGIGLGMVTVVGQCIGAGRKDEAKRYILKLTWYGEVSIIISCVLLYLACDLITTLGCRPLQTDDTRNHNLQAYRMAVLLHAGVRNACRRRRQVLDDYLIHHDVDLPCISHGGAHPFLRLGTYGGMDWYVH